MSDVAGMVGSAPPAGAHNRLITRDFVGTWTELGTADLPPAAAVLTRSTTEALRAVWTHALTPRETLVTAASRVSDKDVSDLLSMGLAVVSGAEVTDPEQPRDPEPGRLWLLTSGSTGRPKRVGHSLDSLTTVGGAQPPRVWLCPYAVGAYAWWQVVTLGLAHAAQDILFVDPDELDSWPERALVAGVTAASGTPTFWRQALLRAGETLAQLPLAQITLGGEPVDQAILTRLSELFPAARVSWIYASSEAGATIAVHDGRAGFPVEWLDRDVPDRARLAVLNGELLVGSPRRGVGIEETLHTGDRAEVVAGRVVITGRLASEEINVGGSKASASTVRAVLQEHPAVMWAHVSGRRAPLVGEVVSAQVVRAGAVSEADLMRWCRDRLPEHAVPRMIRFLDSIPLKETLKSDV